MPVKQKHSMWLTQIGRVGQVSISIHITTALLFLLIIASCYEAGASVSALLILGIGIFVSYAAHEYAHLTMISVFSREHRYLFSNPLHLILYPFGMAVELDKSPTLRALRFSALAGPAASFLLAGCCLTLRPFVEQLNPELILVLNALYQVNIVLGLINVLPFFPFDFSLYARGEHGHSARHLVISIFVNIGLFLLALSFSLYLLAIMFVASSFLGIQMYVTAKTQSAAQGFRAADAMIATKDMTTLSHGLSIHSAAPLVIKSFQSLFPVVQGSLLLGVLAKEALLKSSQVPTNAPIGSCMERNLPTVSSDTPLIEVLQCFDNTNSSVLTVVDEEQFKGLLVKERVIEFLFYALHDESAETAGLRDNE